MRTLQIISLFAVISLQIIQTASAEPSAQLPAGLWQQLRAGQPVDVLIEYDDTEIQQTVRSMRKAITSAPLGTSAPRTIIRTLDTPEIANYEKKALARLKQDVDEQLPDTKLKTRIRPIRGYQRLPFAAKRFESEASLKAFLALKGIKAAYENEKMRAVLTQSLTLVQQSNVSAAGLQGEGTTVAVIDSGINYSLTTFGSCTAPGLPASTCKVVAAEEFTQFASPATDHSHGINVAAIVLGMAPKTKIAALNVFDTAGYANVIDIISAIDWAILNRATYNIVAINMSLGGNTKKTSLCELDWSYTPVKKATDNGISVVVAAGNSGFTDGLSSPACAPAAISVGAVYDSNIGSNINWGTCTDATTATDKVTCFSNSASFLTLLAPGSQIAAASLTQSGTSQAAPHVAGAIAALRAAYPTETLAEIKARLTETGTPVTDSRNSIVKPRLNLLEAARPANNLFAKRISLSGNSGSTSSSNRLANDEPGEPVHAGQSGGTSVWWKWLAPASGQVSLDTHASGVDTLLATYTGNTLSGLNVIASNDDSGSSTSSALLFQAVAGTEYIFAVDGKSGASGLLQLNWSLNTSAEANLSISLTGPSNVSPGNGYDYMLNVVNNGPQTATNVTASVVLPAGTTLDSADSACSLAGQTLTCTTPLLANAASIGFSFHLTWQSVIHDASLVSTVSSDLSDNTSTDNSQSYPITDSSQDGDIPLLPPWALVMMSLIFLVIMKKLAGKRHLI